jgi:hypothetical protein
LGSQAGMHISLSDQRTAFMTITSDTPTYNVMLDVYTGETMVLRDGKVFHVDRRNYAPRRSYLWRSKVIELNYEQNFGAAKIFFANPNGPAPSEPTYFRLYADGRLRYTYPVTKSGQQFRLPSGYLCQTVQFELEGQLMIFNMQVAPSARELREV